MKNIFTKFKNIFYVKDNNDQNELNKQLVLIVVSVIIMVISVMGVTFSAFVWSDNSAKNQGLVVGNIELVISSKSQPLGSGLNYPIPSSQESSLSPYTFTITNTGNVNSVYKLKIVDETDDDNGNTYTNDLDKLYIYMSLDGSANITRTSLKNYENLEIDSGVLKTGQSKTYNLKLWIVDNAPNSVIGKSWHGKIMLESSQRNEWAEQSRNLVDAIKNDNDEQTNFYFNNVSNEYYYKGKSENNYVKFSNNEYQILKINSDSSIRMVSTTGIPLTGSTQQDFVYDTSQVPALLLNWYNSNISIQNQSELLTSNNTKLNIEYLTLSDINNNSIGNTNYNQNSNTIFSGSNYFGNIWINSLKEKFIEYWQVDNSSWGYNTTTDLTHTYLVFPVITLNSNVTTLEGDGIKIDPYVIK